MKKDEFETFLNAYKNPEGEYLTKDGNKFIPYFPIVRKNSGVYITSDIVRFAKYENDCQEITFACLRKDVENKEILGLMGIQMAGYDYVLAIEPKKKKIKGTTITFTDGLKKIGNLIDEESKSGVTFRGIYRTKIHNRNAAEDYYLIAICVIENGNYTQKYFDCYLASSDSRALRDTNYTFYVSNKVDSYNVGSMNKEWESNLLVFGAPGTGKSHYIKNRVDKKVENREMSPEQFMRVTFYADYTYEKFVGAYMPVPRKQTKRLNISNQSTSDLYHGEINAEGISYEFVPGPFLELLAKAITNDIKYKVDTAKNNNAEYIEDNGGKKTKPSRIPYVLIIEEINRANAASVFGDMFQIIERDDSGYSSYGISISIEIKDYLEKEIRKSVGEDADELIQEHLRELKLPCNFYIWATMNSADQGVFPMDTAFKRRWAYIYQSADNNRTDNYQYLYVNYAGKKCFVKWDALRMAINKKIEDAHMEEDRYIGPWYLRPSEFDKIADFTKKHDGTMTTPLFDKIMSYLRQDVFKNYPIGIFKNEYLTFGAIRRAIYNDIPIDEILDIELEANSCKDLNDIEIIVGDKKLNINEILEICNKNEIKYNDDIWMDINYTLMEYKDPEDEIRQKVLENMEKNLKNCLGDEGYKRLIDCVTEKTTNI